MHVNLMPHSGFTSLLMVSVKPSTAHLEAQYAVARCCQLRPLQAQRAKDSLLYSGTPICPPMLVICRRTHQHGPCHLHPHRTLTC